MARERSGYVVRIAPSGGDRVPEALQSNQIIIGWAEAKALDDPSLDWSQFRQIVHQSYYSDEPNFRKSGNAAGHLWCFIRDMEPGDLIVVPHGAEFYVAEATGPASYFPERLMEDSAWRRPVRWLNSKQPIPRCHARAALQSRMKTQGTTAYANDLINEIEECIKSAEKSVAPSFEQDLRQRLCEQTIQEIRSGRLDSYGFERLIVSIMTQLGALDVDIVPRSKDQGADIVAMFRVGGVARVRVAIQARHYQPDPPVPSSVVDYLAQGMQAEDADLGLVITSGTFTDDATQKARQLYEGDATRIELVDGEQLAALVIEHGLTAGLTY